MRETTSKSPQIQLIIGLLIHFWQVGLIQFEPLTKVIKLVVFIDELEEIEFQKLKTLVMDHIQVHHDLVGIKEISGINLKFIADEKLNQIVIERILDTFYRKDITIILELITEYLSLELILDNDWSNFGNLMEIEELDLLVNQAISNQGDQRLTGIRSDGHLAVYPI